jgi:hypothetical protein
MREIVAWVVPLMLSLFLIQSAAELLSMRAATHQVGGSGAGGGPKQQTIRGPVHEVESAVTASGIIT